MLLPGSNANLPPPRLVSTPHGENELTATVTLILLEVLFVTRPKTATPLPRATVEELVPMLKPISEDCALTGQGTEMSARQASNKTVVTKYFLIDLSSCLGSLQRAAGTLGFAWPPTLRSRALLAACAATRICEASKGVFFRWAVGRSDPESNEGSVEGLSNLVNPHVPTQIGPCVHRQAASQRGKGPI